MANGLEIVLSDPSVRSVFVNVFGGITACDAWPTGSSRPSACSVTGREGQSPDRRAPGWQQRGRGRRILDEAGIGVSSR